VRRTSTILALVATLLLLLGTAACGGSASPSAGLDDGTPQGILSAAMTAAENMTGATGTFDVTITVDADTTKMPAPAQAFVTKPVSLSGTLAYGSEPQAADMTMSLSMAGQAMEVGVKILADKGWLQLGGQWYEAPPELGDMMAGASTDRSAQTARIEEALAAAGVDPLTWIKDLRLVGEEKVDGIEAYHLSGAPDLAKIVADVMALTQDPEAMKAFDPSGALSTLMGGGADTTKTSENAEVQGFAMDPTMFAEIQQQIAAMFQGLTADVWIAKDDLMMLRLTAGATMVPPADEKDEGLNSVTLDVDLELRDHNEPVTVEPPVGAKPFSALEEAAKNDPASLLGPLGGIFGLTGGFSFGGATQ